MNWVSGQPDDDKNEDCSTITKKGNGQWNDIGCVNPKVEQDTLCERMLSAGKSLSSVTNILKHIRSKRIVRQFN